MSTRPFFHIVISVVFLFTFIPRNGAAQEKKLLITPLFADTPSDTDFSIHFNKVKRPTVCLVLSGGGARGIAHVGVIKELEKHHIPIDYIVGTSIGGIIGGLYASGYSTEELEAIVDTTDWNYVLSLTQDNERKDLYLSHKVAADRKQLSIRFDGLRPILPSALSSGQRLTNFINQLTLQSLYHPVKNFDDLKIPFRCVSTDLISGQQIVFASGNLSEALRASISIPLLYNPLKKDTLELTDGGLISNIPVDVARRLGADIIIAVNAVSPLRTATQLNNPWEVTDQIVSIMAQEKNKRALDSATIVITPDLGSYPTLDFSNLTFVKQQGVYAARMKIDAILDSINTRKMNALNDASPLSNFSFKLRSVSFSSIETDTALFMPLTRIRSTSIPALREQISLVYETGKYQHVSGELTISDQSADLTIRTELNPRLNQIRFTGNTLIDSGSLSIPYQPLIGQPFNVPQIDEATEQMLGQFRGQGFSLARVRSRSFDTLSGILTLNLHEGTIQSIYLKGKETSRDWVIWRELGFRDGNIFTVDKGRQALLNLYGTNLFEQVLMDVGYENDLPVITIQMEEKPTDVSRLGFRIDDERNVQPSLEIRNENLFGTATELGASFAGGLRNRKYIADFQANRIFNSYFTFNMDAYYDLRDIYTYYTDPIRTNKKAFVRSREGEYRQILYGVSFQLGRQVERFGIINIEYRLEADEIKFISGKGYNPEQFTLQAFRISSTIDSRDRYPFAQKGSLTNFSWETSTSSLKSVVGDVGYSKIYFTYETNASYQNFTLHPKIVIGFGDQTLPLSQQFSLGGEDSFFGLREYDTRGRQIFLTSLELRTRFPFQIIWDTYFRIRYDLGSIWPQREDIRLRDFHHGLGAILSIDTPAGPINVAVGRSFYIRQDLLEQPLTLGPLIAYLSLGYPIL
ncbi:MAG: patatin-like phospholipase family protein [Bacteroidetes bacterium]|nr:patatin-like phospholipase family protein [Bacteroidota bacterium]